jgi:YVTN family beta-propeller protein
MKSYSLIKRASFFIFIASIMIVPFMIFVNLPILTKTPQVKAALLTQMLYVTNAADNTVSQINVSTNPPSILNTIALPAGGTPSSIAISPDGTTAYVTDSTLNMLYPIDLTQNPPVPKAGVSTGPGPIGVVISPSGSDAYVLDYNSSGQSGLVQDFNLLTSPPSLSATLNVGLHPTTISINNSGTLLYITNGASETVSQINLPSFKSGMTLSLQVGTSLAGGSFSPDSMWAYLSGGINSSVAVVSVPAQSVQSIISLSSANVTAVQESQNANYLFAADANNNVVYPINPTNFSIGSAISVDSYPNMMTYNNSDTELFVVNEQGNSSCGAFGSNGSLSTINLSNDTVSSTICLGKSPSGIAISPVPVISSITPNSGSFSGAETVTINGSGFLTGSQVYFGSQQSTNVTVLSSTQVIAQSPPSSPSNTTPVVDVTVTDSLGSSVTTPTDLFAYGRQSAYVVDATSGDVKALSTSINPQSVLGSISVSNPSGQALSSDGQTLYVISASSGSVTVVNTSNFQSISSFYVQTGIDSIALSPNSDLALLTDSSNNSLYAVNLTTSPPTVYPALSVCNDPTDVAIAPDGSTAYVICTNSNSVVSVNIANLKPVLIGNINVGVQPVAEAFSSDGQILYVVNANSSASAGSVTPIYLGASGYVGSSFLVGKAPDAIAITPDDNYALVANSQSDTVSVISLTTNSLLTSVTVGAVPKSITIVDSGAYADVVNGSDNSVTPINLANFTAGSSIAVGQNPINIVSNGPPAVLNLTPADGSTLGGNQIAIYGVNFTPQTQVYFGSTLANYAEFISPSKLVVSVPPGSGVATLSVTNENGTSYNLGSANQYQYVSLSNEPIAIATGHSTAQAYSISTFGNLLSATLSVGNGPYGVAITTGRTLALLTNGADGTVSPINLQTNPISVEPAVKVCQSGSNCTPTAIAISPDDSTAFIALNGSSQIAVFDIAKQSVLQYVDIPGAPQAIAVSPDGVFVYVLYVDTLTRLYQTSSGWAVDSASSVNTGNGAASLVVSPDGNYAYVANTTDNTVVQLSLLQDPINLTQTYLVSIPHSLAITPDGHTLYVGNALMQVTPINLQTSSVGSPIIISNGASASIVALAMSPDGAAVWGVSYNTNEVVEIPTASNLALSTIQLPTGAAPNAIAVSWPVSSPTAVQNLAVNPGNQSLNISWSAPLSDGGSPVTSYSINIVGPQGPLTPITVNGTTFSYTQTGLTNMAGYKVSVSAINSVGTGVAANSQIVYPQITAGEFVPLVPSRILDTRTGNGTNGVIGPLGPNSSLNLQVAGRGGVPSSGVSAVVMNVTGVNATAISYLTVYPTGNSLPVTSNLNLAPNEPATPNLVTVGLGKLGNVTIYNFNGTVDVIADVVGYYTDGSTFAESRFDPLSPSRILDTRTNLGLCQPSPCASIGPNSSISVTVAGQGGVPAGQAVGVVMNVTATQSSATSYLTIYPTGQSRPLASDLNFVPNQTVPNLVVSELGKDGQISIYNASGVVDVLIDVVGYFTLPGSINGARFSPLVPKRILDTRINLGSCSVSCSALGSNSTLTLQVTGINGSALLGASGAIMNVTAISPTQLSYLTIYPSNVTLPVASDLNFVAGQTTANSVASELSSSGQISIYNFKGTVNVAVDIYGYFNDGST